MAGGLEQLDAVPGFTVPVHRALTEHILLGGAPRSIAIMNGTLAGAVGLGLRLWLVGLAIWAIGHFARRMGGEARSAIRRGRAQASAHPRPSGGVRARP
jgi:type IV secretory pathway TrbD component